MLNPSAESLSVLQITAFSFMFEKVWGVHDKPFLIRCAVRTPLRESTCLASIACLIHCGGNDRTYSPELLAAKTSRITACAACRLRQQLPAMAALSASVTKHTIVCTQLD